MKQVTTLFFTSLLSMALLAACNLPQSSVREVEPAAVEATGTSGREQSGPSPGEGATTDEPEEGSPTASEVVPLATSDRSTRLTPGPLPEGAERVPAATAEPVVEPVPEEILDKVLADLRLQAALNTLDPDEYEVIRSQAVIWQDGSLGCPQPGVTYTQAPVAGYWVVIEASGKTWDYRAAESGALTLCEQTLTP